LKEKFDTIIVGAGPAGCIAAYQLAKAGLTVLVLERGEYPGSKNVFGGILHTSTLNRLFPQFWEEAPVERYIVKRVLVLLGEKSSTSLEFRCQDYGNPPYNGFTTFRAKFDRWLAGKAEEAGALIMTDTRVDDLLYKNGNVIGVKVAKSEGDVFGDVVIAADGVNSLIAKKAKLRKPFLPEHLALGIKETWELPKGLIEKRCDLSGNEGAAYLFVGESTKGLEGGSFIYTNKKSLSIGITCYLNSLIRERKKPSEVIENFKKHPVVSDFIREGSMREYSTHLIPEGGLHMMPQLYSGGILLAGDAAGFTVNNGLNVRGADFAIASGIIAAKTVLKAKKKADFSKNSLSIYKKLLAESFVLKDLKTYTGISTLLKKKSTYEIYLPMISDLVKGMYDVGNYPQKKISRMVWDKVREKRSIGLFLKDIFQGIRSL
jgi:electron transfer flavoprotein-quinone oxidoreductase